MKKQYLAVAFLAVALGITACSSKKADTESTTAQAVESTEATSDEEVEEIESYIEDNFDAEVDIIEGKQPVYSFIIGVE